MNPYIIGPYTEDDASRFWGRTQEIEGMYKSFLQNDYLVLILGKVKAQF